MGTARAITASSTCQTATRTTTVTDVTTAGPRIRTAVSMSAPRGHTSTSRTLPESRDITEMPLCMLCTSAQASMATDYQQFTLFNRLFTDQMTPFYVKLMLRLMSCVCERLPLTLMFL